MSAGPVMDARQRFTVMSETNRRLASSPWSHISNGPIGFVMSLMMSTYRVPKVRSGSRTIRRDTPSLPRPGITARKDRIDPKSTPLRVVVCRAMCSDRELDRPCLSARFRGFRVVKHLLVLCRLQDLNLQPPYYKYGALPIAPSRRSVQSNRTDVTCPSSWGWASRSWWAWPSASALPSGSRRRRRS